MAEEIAETDELVAFFSAGVPMIEVAVAVTVIIVDAVAIKSGVMALVVKLSAAATNDGVGAMVAVGAVRIVAAVVVEFEAVASDIGIIVNEATPVFVIGGLLIVSFVEIGIMGVATGVEAIPIVAVDCMLKPSGTPEVAVDNAD